MTKPDDSTLSTEDRRAVEERARKLLDRASAWGTFPTPVDDLVSAAQLKVTYSAFDPRRMLAFVQEKAGDAAHVIKSALSKVLGICDSDEQVIHIDDSVGTTKQKFLKLHETGHHELPTHRKLFRLFQDCEKTLAPEVADQFEREANNFARFVMFQGDEYRKCAADEKMTIRTPMNLAKKFGSSIYASAREFVRTHHRPCAVYVLEPITYAQGVGAVAQVRRIEVSPGFELQFGRPSDTAISLNHALGSILPIGRRMTRPTTVCIADRNGDRHECIADAFDTTWNILILLYPIRALANQQIYIPV